MTAIVPVLRAIVRDELSASSGIELGVVTGAASNEGGQGDRNGEVDVRLRGSALQLQRVPVAGSRIGLAFVPRIGDLVVVGFVGGDLNGAVVLGCLHTDKVHPPDATPAEIVYQVPDPADDAVRRAEIRLPSGNTLTVLDNKVVIDLGASVITVDGGRVSIAADEGIDLTTKGDLKVKADGNVSIEAGGDADLTATGSLTAQGIGSAKLAGPTVTVAGNTSFSPG